MKHKETLSTNKGNKEFYITNLKQEDIRDILLLEQKSRTPELQASEGIVNTRLQNWHIIMWIKKWNNLVSKIAFSYQNFSKEKLDKFPSTFEEFSTLPSNPNFNSAFIYNLDTDPNYRGSWYTERLIQATIDKLSKDWCRYIYFDARPSSYNWDNSEQQSIKQNLEFKKTIDEFLKTQIMPTKDELLKDPTLAFYNHNLKDKLEFIKIIPDFINDKASWDFRIIAHLDLTKLSEISLSEERIAISEAMYGKEFIAELNNFLKSQTKWNSILECGCWWWHIIKWLHEQGRNWTGIDSDQLMIEHAKKNNNWISFLQMDWNNLDGLDWNFDCIMCRWNNICVKNRMDEKDTNPKEKIQENIQKMRDKLNKWWILYLDTAPYTDENKISLKTDNIDLEGKVSFNKENNTRYTFWWGLVNWKKFIWWSENYLISSDELEIMLENMNPKPSKVLKPSLQNEKVYSIVCAIK